MFTAEFRSKIQFIFLESANMKQGSCARRDFDVYMRVDPEFPERIVISTNENEAESGVRYRRRTTSMKRRRPAEKRRASVPAFYKLNVTPTNASRKNLFQKFGSRLAKIGDELVKRNRLYKAGKFGCKCEGNTMKQYGRQLADIGDYLNELYSNEQCRLYSESYHATLAENCMVLASILIGLKNNNIVVVNSSDLKTLSSICRVHRAKSMSKARK